MELHRGRLIDHVQLVVKDLPASRRFYDAVLEALGVPIAGVVMTFSGRTNSWSLLWTAKLRRAS